jgi:hypothetical protein
MFPTFQVFENQNSQISMYWYRRKCVGLVLYVDLVGFHQQIGLTYFF